MSHIADGSGTIGLIARKNRSRGLNDHVETTYRTVNM